MRRLIVPSLGALLLGGAVMASVAARGHGPDEGAGWFLLADGAELKLVYGQPASDNIGLMLTCVPGETVMIAYGEVAPDLASLTLVDQGPSLADPLSGGSAFSMSLAVDEPGLRLLPDEGYLPVRMERGRGRLVATAAERQMANRFLNACTQQHA